MPRSDVRRRRGMRAGAVVLLGLVMVLGGCGSASPGAADEGAASDAGAAAEEPPEVLRLDYAYYSPVSLVLREFGWMEEEFEPDGIRVEWVLSLGSNKANENLASGTVAFASTAGSAALMARANGVPLKTVWIYGQPEWTALVVRSDSPALAVGDLRGRRIAATRGTDPYFFLIRALDDAGLGGARRRDRAPAAPRRHDRAYVGAGRRLGGP